VIRFDTTAPFGRCQRCGQTLPSAASPAHVCALVPVRFTPARATAVVRPPETRAAA
jgi:hypothetical protein